MTSESSAMTNPAAENTLGVFSRILARLGLSSVALRVWGAKSAFSLIDQSLTSAAGFILNILLARWLDADSYGAFAVAFAGYLFVSGFHNVLLLEPLSVLGPSRYSLRMRAYFRTQLTVHAILLWPLSGAVLAAALTMYRVSPHNPLVGALLGSGLSLPFLLLLWLARRMCYAFHRPEAAVLGSGVYLLTVILGLLLLRRLNCLTPFSAFILAGTGSMLGASVLIRKIGTRQGDIHTNAIIPWRIVFRENLTYGRWLAGSAILYSLSSQVQMFLVAGFLGLEQAGVLRALQIPMQFMSQVITAAGMLLLPTLALDFGKVRTERLRDKAAFVSLSLSVVAVCFVVLLALFSKSTEHLLFNGKYSASAGLIPVLALVSVFNAFSTGYSMGMRGSQMPQFDLVANAVAAPTAVLSAYYFMRWWGLAGAAISIVLTFAVIALITFVCFKCFLVSSRGNYETPRR